MTNLINDLSLVVFSPLNEPSGTPTFRNLAPRFLDKDISYDWHPMIAANLYADQVLSLHPGSDFVINAASGTTYLGYRAQGASDLGVQNSNAANKVLAWGVGQSDVRSLMAPPSVAQSGFTVGVWVYPTSDGAWNSDNNGTNEENAERHLLLGRGNASDGFIIGVSGRIAFPAQDNIGDYQGGLRAFCHVKQNSVHLTTPLEEGRYTHLTMTYRYIDGNNNQIVLYKDGRVTASGTTNEELGSANVAYSDRVFTIGGGQDGSSIVDGVEFASGWGHLVSGVYGFDRPLHEGEIATLHDCGGLQASEGFMEGAEVVISDPTLVAYVPVIEPGLIDVSRNHNNFFSDRDVGIDARLTICPGPFNRALCFKDDTTDDIAIATGSGVINSILDGNGSFSIGGWFYIRGTQTTFDANTLISLGSIGTGERTPDRSTGGFHISSSGTSNNHRLIARMYDGGLVGKTLEFTTSDTDMWGGLLRHVTLAYDAQTRGVAFYVDKRLASSGTLDTPFEDVMSRLAGSGYPFVFLNGIVQDTVDTFDTSAGIDSAVGDMFVFSRPLQPQEIVGIAESGIDFTSLYYTRHDPRLRGFWRGTDSSTNDLNFPDEAMSMRGNAIPGNMVKGLSDLQWDVVLNNIDTTQHSTVDLLSVSRGEQGGPSDVYDGPLGFTSGAFAVMGGSLGVFNNNTAGPNKRGTSTGNPFRYRPVAEDRDIYSQHIINDYVIAFEVTPSGTIPATSDGNTEIHNCNLVVYGEPATQDRLISYLTTEDGAGSGIVVRFDTRDSTIQQNLVQASLPYGIPSRVAFVARPVTPYDDISNHETNNIQVSIYVDGQLVNTVQHQSNLADIWSDGSLNSLTLLEWILTIGGRHVHESQSTHVVLDAGLGDIHLRNLSIWIGALSQNDIDHIVTSGVRASTTTGYSDTVDVDTVTTADPNLKGLWRLAGESPQSGVFDSSIAGNNLENLAQSMQEQAGGPAFSSADNAADNLLFVPGPFVNAPLSLRGSGVTYAGDAPNIASNAIAPLAASGTDFNSPNTGFTFGIWVVTREAVSSNSAKVIASYGPVPASAASTAWVDASWALVIDEAEDFSFYLSKDGRMPMDSSSSTDLVNQCAIKRSNFGPSDTFELHRQGGYGNSHADTPQHLIFSYDASTNVLKGYLNGEQVSRVDVDPSGFHVPLSVDARILSFITPQHASPWNYAVTLDDPDSIIFEPFYFDRAITDAEARFIATRGISEPVTTTVSGIAGGYIRGKDFGSGLIGGYLRGQDTFSGIIGGYIDGVDARDGTIGGFIRGRDNFSGIMGGYVRGQDFASGIIGGYITSSALASGLIGGYILAGFQGNVQFDGFFTVNSLASADFDASLQVLASNTSEFDAQIQVFRAEEPPVVSIVTPPETVEGVLAPLSQYFVGQALASSGRTITKASFTFSDFSSQVNVTESGNGLFALSENHVFAQSGLYVVRFSVIDSEGMHASATRIINLASGIDPVQITLSGIPEHGNAPLDVQFTQTQESVPAGVGIVANLLDYDDGVTTISLNTVHKYTEPGIYRPIWIVRDSRGFIWSDSLTIGINN